MQINTSRKLSDNIPEIKKANYHIDQSAVVHITRILRNMYEDPVRAVVREYIANAYDAHNQVGQKELISIDAPTRMVPTFRVRDYGPGLAVAEVEKLLLGYGASGEHKRASNEQIGGFGIGCKCAFAISDTFTYVSWHGGMKQTWLCQLDDHDMGEAKLISHEKSNEPSGLMVEIPVSASQMPLFEKQLKQVPLFFQQPVKISGKVFKPADDIGIKLKGQMAGEFSGCEWMFYTLKNGLTNAIDFDVVVIMGDLWYPVEKSFLDELQNSRLLRIIRPGARRARGYGYADDDSYRKFRCAIRAPIGTFSLAPTRESLQYDTATRKALKAAFKAIEDNITARSQKDIDACPDIWSASEKALDLQEDLMYETGRDKAKEPTFAWNGTTYTFAECLGVKAEDDSTGATILYAARDLRNGSSYYYRRSPGNLKVRHFKLNAPGMLPETARGLRKDSVPAKTITAATSLADHLGKDHGWSTGHNDDDNRHPAYALLDGGSKTATGAMKVTRYVFPEKTRVFTIGPKDNAEFYSKRYLIHQDSHVPKPDGSAIVIQGEPDQIEAVFKMYPWMKAVAKPLPIIKVMTRTKTAADGTTTEEEVQTRSFKSAENMFKYKAYDSELPSRSWEALESLPKDMKHFVYLERFIPTHKSPKTAAGATESTSLSPATQYAWLNAGTGLLRLLLDKPALQVYGFRSVGSKIKPPDGLELLPDTLSEQLKNWMSAKSLGTYKVHGFQVMLRYGPDGMFGELGFHDAGKIIDFDAPKRRHGRNSHWYYADGTGLELIRLLRTQTAKARVAKLPTNSLFRQFAEMYWKLTGLDSVSETVLAKYELHVKNLYSHTMAEPAVVKELPKLAQAELARYAKPLQDLTVKVWNKYTMIGLLDNIPDSDDGDVNSFMDYIELIDNK